MSFLKNLTTTCTLVLIATFYYGKTINHLPRGKHAWAQADRLSLAMDYHHNGLGFFKPSTLNCRSKDGIVGVEFPLQGYIVAVLAKIVGQGYLNLIFRLSTMLLCFLALFYLFKAGQIFTGNFLVALATPVFLFCSPLLVYYTNSYLPDIAGFAFTVLAYCLYLLHFSSGDQQSPSLKSIAVMTLGVLCKMSTGTFLVVLLLLQFRMIWQRNHRSFPGNTGRSSFFRFVVHQPFLRLFLFTILSFSLILAWFLYIKYLNSVYQDSVFLSKAKPLAGSFSEILNYSKAVFLKWRFDYLSFGQWVLLCLALVVWLFLPKDKTSSHWKFVIPGCFLAGGVSYAVMGGQYLHHDYYALTSFYPFVAFSMLGAMILMNKHFLWINRYSIFQLLTFSVLSLVLIFPAKNLYEKKRFEDENYSNSRWLFTAKIETDQLAIPRSKKILISAGRPGNLGLVYFDRKGISLKKRVQNTSIKELNNAMDKHQLDYLVISREERENMVGRACFDHYFEEIQLKKDYAVFEYLIPNRLARRVEQGWQIDFNGEEGCLYPYYSKTVTEFEFGSKRYSQSFVLNEALLPRDSFSLSGHVTMQPLQSNSKPLSLVVIIGNAHENTYHSFLLEPDSTTTRQRLPFDVRISNPNSGRMRAYLWAHSKEKYALEEWGIAVSPLAMDRE